MHLGSGSRCPTLTADRASGRRAVRGVGIAPSPSASIGANRSGLHRGSRLDSTTGAAWSLLGRRRAQRPMPLVRISRQLLRHHGRGVLLSEFETGGGCRTLYLSDPVPVGAGRGGAQAHRRREEHRAARVWRNEANLTFTSTMGTPLEPEVFGKSVPRISRSVGASKDASSWPRCGKRCGGGPAGVRPFGCTFGCKRTANRLTTPCPRIQWASRVRHLGDYTSPVQDVAVRVFRLRQVSIGCGHW